MSEFRPIEFDGEFKKEYWEGKSNAFVRYWIYLNEGFEVVNKAKNYFLIVFGTFWTATAVKIWGYEINADWILVAGCIGFPLLILVGRWMLYKAAKPQEFMRAYKASILGYTVYNMQVRQVELLESINKKLEK